MTRPRSEIVSLDKTPYYNCVSRCVRCAFLCGEDRFSGKNFDHRKPWLMGRLALLAELFAIDIVFLRGHEQLPPRGAVCGPETKPRLRAGRSHPPLAASVRGRYSGPLPFVRGVEVEVRQLNRIVKTWRKRLSDISWIMRCMNEYITRRANGEDDCTDRFWEGRFKSQALLDEAAVLSCMAYVDLNPARAGLCETLEESDNTSTQARLRGAEGKNATAAEPPFPKLMPLGTGREGGAGREKPRSPGCPKTDARMGSDARAREKVLRSFHSETGPIFTMLSAPAGI